MDFNFNEEGLKDIENLKERMVKRHIDHIDFWKDSVEGHRGVAVLERPMER